MQHCSLFNFVTPMPGICWNDFDSVCKLVPGPAIIYRFKSIYKQYQTIIELDRFTNSLHQCFARQNFSLPYISRSHGASIQESQSGNGTTLVFGNLHIGSRKTLQRPKLAQAQSPYPPIPRMPHPGSVWSAVRNPCPWEALSKASKLEGHDHGDFKDGPLPT